ncbi:MAG: pseudouridine synthase [Bacilli bacterium]|nr:pseudouridine synthase [Bacilli bacterium]
MERLQKYLARCGVASRRASEKLILEGRVSVNGVVVTLLGTKVSPKDDVRVDGNALNVEETVVLVMNKPRYTLSTVKDEKDRKTVMSLLPPQYQKVRLYPVGRLDYDTKGVLLLTNDGELSNQLVGPRSQIEKEYLARVEGIPTKEELKTLALGVLIDGVKTRRSWTYLDSTDLKNNSALVRIVLREGRYHQVKKMFEAINHPVKRLTRIRFANIVLENLQEGEVRELSIHELKHLRLQAEQSPQESPVDEGIENANNS